MKIICFSTIYLLVFLAKFGSFRSLSPAEINNLLNNVSPTGPVITEFSIRTNVSNRFAETEVESKVENPKNALEQTTFTVVIPESAYITGFSMEINGKEYKSFVADKEKAKQLYSRTSPHGAAHVALSTRDSNRFDVTVNVEPRSTATFRLLYEELLERKKSQYEIISNIFPEQIVSKLNVEITIKETRPLAFVQVPALRSGNENLKNANNPNAKVDIQYNSATIKYSPNKVDQLLLACSGLGNSDNVGLGAQFIVQYDVQRNNDSEVLAEDGYFVHFFAPTNLEPLSKQIAFILDSSGSMRAENKMGQLKDAMSNILPKLRDDDLFNIITFEELVHVWDIENSQFVSFQYPGDKYEGGLSPPLEATQKAPAIPATRDNIDKAITVVNKLRDGGATNIVGALTVGLHVTDIAQNQKADQYQPVIVFLTDGEANGAMHDCDLITSEITRKNSLKVPIYTISLGERANRTFLRILAKHNDGYEKHIYEAADISMQLQHFYDDISMPVLSKINFESKDTQDLTTTSFPLLFNGSELTVAGKGVLWKISQNQSADFKVSAKGRKGTIEFHPSIEIPTTKLERLWAYLTVKQLLQERESNPYNKEIVDRALNISLAYSLVTDVTALIVVKPNEESSIDIKSAFLGKRNNTENPICSEIDRNTLVDMENKEETTTEGILTTLSEEVPTTLPTTTQTITTTESQSLNSTSDICKLPSKTGTLCKEYSAMWYYDQEDGCRQFWYGGCDGNENRFDTLRECQQKCHGESAVIEPVTTTITPEVVDGFPDICSLPSDSGSVCKNYTLYWYYEKETCKSFWYGGCDGNDNRFETSEACLNTCSKNTAAAVTEEPIVSEAPEVESTTIQSIDTTTESVSDICTLPSDSGTLCKNYTLYWYYEKETCKSFWYGGCDGNDNRFESSEDCLKTCSKTSDTSSQQPPITEAVTEVATTTIIPTEVADICKLPSDTGTACKNFTIYWYFDENQICQQFWYGGCDGNGNRFETLNDCELKCSGSGPAQEVSNTTVATYVQTTEKTVVAEADKDDICSLKHVTGPCGNYEGKWYFDGTQCNQFWYGGCDGNENRFDTLEDCKERCDKEDVCKLEKDPGPCHDYKAKWYFDGTDCAQFWYGGCDGNGNSFDTAEACKNKCHQADNSTITSNVAEGKCNQPKDKGPCSDYISLWYHDPATKQCLPFDYGGCQGNENRFMTKFECDNECSTGQVVDIYH